MAQQPPSVVTVITEDPITARYRRTAGFKLGVVQLLCGLLVLSLGILLISLDSAMSALGTGIWCGLFFIATGVVGMLSGGRKCNSCLIVSFLVLSIIASILATILFFWSLLVVLFTGRTDKHYRVTSPCDAIVLILAIVEGITGIVSSVICCRATCVCCHKHQSSGTIYFCPQQAPIGTIPGQQLRVITLPQSPGALYSVPASSILIQQGNPTFSPSLTTHNPAPLQEATSSAPFFPQVEEDENNQFQYVPLH